MFARLVVPALLAASIVTPALAQGRPDARSMTCGQVRSLIAQRGAVVITTGPHTYDRFVAGQRWCDHPYVPMTVRISTSDGRCVVYNCQRDPFEDWWR